MKRLRITLEGKTYEVDVEVIENKPVAATIPQQTAFSRPPQVAAAAPLQPQQGGTQVLSPMAGQVFKCLVKAGDQVAQQQVVIILEAMKMETPIYASVAGVVRSVLVKEGDAVDEGDLLLQIEG